MKSAVVEVGREHGAGVLRSVAAGVGGRPGSGVVRVEEVTGAVVGVGWRVCGRGPSLSVVDA